MATLITNKEAKERMIKFLKENQYLFTLEKSGAGWIVIVEE